jgi:hypothetical protein
MARSVSNALFGEIPEPRLDSADQNFFTTAPEKVGFS